jgi:hypothetical protein
MCCVCKETSPLKLQEAVSSCERWERAETVSSDGLSGCLIVREVGESTYTEALLHVGDGRGPRWERARREPHTPRRRCEMKSGEM